MTPSELHAWREARGLSRRAAAELLGLNERTLEGLEYGRRSDSALFPVLERFTLLIDQHDPRQPAAWLERLTRYSRPCPAPHLP